MLEIRYAARWKWGGALTRALTKREKKYRKMRRWFEREYRDYALLAF